jgi:hypothetical protein
MVFGGITLSDASAAQFALGLSLVGIALAILALILVLRLMRSDAKKAGDKVGDLEELTERADRLGRTG